jgi:hypothetical protein
MNDAYGHGDDFFTVSTTHVRYTGFTAISGSFNSGDVVFSFA